MKILYITNGITGVGGLERVLSVKTSYLVDVFKYEIVILSLNEENKSPYYIFSKNIKTRSISIYGNPLKYLKAYFVGIKKIITEERPDRIIVCDDGLKAFFLPIVFKNNEFIYERHVSAKILYKDNSSFIKNILAKLQAFLMNKLSKYFKYFVVLNEGNKDEWDYKKNIIVIGNPFSFYPEQQAKLDNLKVIAVGKQSYQKNYERLIGLWKSIAIKYPNWELHIYGKEDISLGLQKLINECKLEDSIFLHQPVKNIQEKYLESSLFVMTSRFEGMPMVMLEAMACGLPLLSFDCPHGPRELIVEDYNGYLISYKDDASWVEKASVIMGDNSKRKSLGNNSRLKSLEYSIPKVMEKWNFLINN